MNSISGIATSALQAYSLDMHTIAGNMARIGDQNAVADRTAFRTTSGGGVEATVVPTMDRVDISREAVGMIADRNGFAANLKVLKAADEMEKELLNIRA